MIINVPMPLNIANGSHGHWATRKKQKDAYFRALDIYQAVGKIPKPPAKPFAMTRIAVVMYLANRMDADNTMRRCKWPLDWLKTRGYIKDDSPKHLDWADIPEQIIKRSGQYRIVFTLSEGLTPAVKKELA